jgi:CRP/FNR family transcriptional regulator, cyclic AMP receptor protein
VIFDERMLVIARRWPRLMLAILERGAEQPRHALLQQAISQLPRIEDRLLALFWSIADRRGTVRPDGICVRLRVTHETLARMTGARRPTVSLGLRTLADDGLVRPDDGGWIINPESIELLASR